jgi:hypothetical protein
MIQVSIPTPCSEDWSKMTPTDKGAFCKKCSLEVIDFTKKSPEEIRETLTLNLGKKICGHIGKNQMETANSYFYMWENQSPQILRSKFLYACILVFGMTLFTGCENDPQVQGEMTNEIEAVDGGIDVEMTGDTVVTYDADTTNSGECSFSTDLKGRMMIDLEQ